MSIRNEICRLLPEGCSLGGKIQYFEEIGSTNTYAKQIAADAEHGTVVLADRQTAGRGRLGKSFHSPDGGLYMSVILRNDLPASDLMAVTACTASAVYSALAGFGITTKIKWVNDLFLNDRKLCGILCEGGFRSDGTMDHLIIGIGLNLHADALLPAELRSIITDIETETGVLIERNALTVSILANLDRFLQEISTRSFLDIYRNHSYTLGKRVIVSRETSECEGLAVDYTHDAALVVRFDDGTKQEITSGTARFINENG